jgi:hypothetical protein
MDEMKVPDVEYKGKCGEIFKLHRMLDEAGIQHEFFDCSTKGLITERVFYHLLYPSVEDYDRAMDLHTDHSSEVCSVIEGDTTFGNEQDLLEIRGLLTPEEEQNSSVCGYLTAENVFKRIKAAEERRKELFRHTAPTDTDYLVEEGS